MDRTVWLTLGKKKHPLRFSYATTEFIEEKYGDYDGMVEALTKGDHKIRETLDIVTVLNHQACAWLNNYNADLPKQRGADIDDDGNYIPLDREFLANSLDRDSYSTLLEAITEAFVKSRKNEIEGTPTAEAKKQKKRTESSQTN